MISGGRAPVWNIWCLSWSDPFFDPVICDLDILLFQLDPHESPVHLKADTTPTVPEPKNGSNTNSPSFVLASMQGLTNSFGKEA